MKSNRIKQTWDDKLFDVINISFLSIILVIFAYPLLYVLIASLSSSRAVIAGEVWLWPVEINLKAYEYVFSDNSIILGYKNSLIYTFLGVILNLILTILCSFSLSRKQFYGRNIVSGMLVFTMFFSGGLIPSYLLVKQLGMLDTTWAMILPGAMSAWNVILMRTYMQSLPEELFESAELDGCSVYRSLWSIVIPLSGSIIAVVALYSAVWIWNSYFDGFIYLSTKEKYPLQVILRNVLILNQSNQNVQDLREMAQRRNVGILLKYAIIVVASLPLLMFYPFVQKYFVKGVMIGSVKG